MSEPQYSKTEMNTVLYAGVLISSFFTFIWPSWTWFVVWGAFFVYWFSRMVWESK